MSAKMYVKPRVKRVVDMQAGDIFLHEDIASGKLRKLAFDSYIRDKNHTVVNCHTLGYKEKLIVYDLHSISTAKYTVIGREESEE